MKKLKKIIAILFISLFVVSVSACGSQPKAHTTDFGDAKGQWTLDSIYKDSHAKHLDEYYKQDMELSDSAMKITITTKEKKKNVTKTIDYTVSNSGDGKFTVSGNNETIEYTFNYDPGAEVLHLYNTDTNGKEVHTIYQTYQEEIPWDKKTDDKNNK